MSRYMLDKVMWEIDRTDEALAEFRHDPQGYLESWQMPPDPPLPPVPTGGTLTPTEQDALKRHDYGALYAMGANPFLLWQFARSVSVPHEMGIEDLVESFRAAVEPHGYPDFHT